MTLRRFSSISFIVLVIFILGTSSSVRGAPAAASVLTGYYTMWGYEGIPTQGFYTGNEHGNPPPVEDYVSSQCRFIDIAPVEGGHYYLRYPLHLPNGVTITKVSLYVADFNVSGSMHVWFQHKTWNSSGGGSFMKSADTGANGAYGEQQINMAPLNIIVNNETTQYWVDVTPDNPVVSPDAGSLCVYGIQVTYTYNGAFLPLMQK